MPIHALEWTSRWRADCKFYFCRLLRTSCNIFWIAVSSNFARTNTLSNKQTNKHKHTPQAIFQINMVSGYPVPASPRFSFSIVPSLCIFSGPDRPKLFIYSLTRFRKSPLYNSIDIRRYWCTRFPLFWLLSASLWVISLGRLGGVMASDLRSSGRGFDSRSGRYQATEVNSAFQGFHPSGVGKSSTGLSGWG